MQFNNIIGESLEAAKEYIKEHNINAVFVETKDRYNDYKDKRIIQVKQIDKGDKLEFLYTGFPPHKE